MTVTTAPGELSTSAEVPREPHKDAAGAVDTDVHPYFREGLASLKPYLSRAMHDRLGLGAKPAWSKSLAASEYSIPTLHYYIHGGNTRPDSAPPSGGPPASDPAFLVKDLIERHGLGAAVLNGGAVLSLGGIPDPDAASAIASAHNEWIAEEWLTVDKRVHGSIVISPRDPKAAVAEIEKWAHHPGMVQIHLPEISDATFGKRYWWPVYEAAQGYGLPVCTHPGGQCAGANTSMMAGLPTTFAEFWSCLPQVMQAHVVSLVMDGALEQFPDMKFVFIEGGFSWLPTLMWRLDSAWKNLRREVPWLTRKPSEYVRTNLRFTTQPIDEPPRLSDLHEVLEMMGAEEILMFSTDYPHWDGDEPHRVVPKIPKAMRPAIFKDTARDVYKLRV